MINKSNFNFMLASLTLNLLNERKARLYPDRKSFYVWPRADRVVVIFDTAVIDIGKVNDDFVHRLSTRLQGRLVALTNSRGLFLQVGYEIPPVLAELMPTRLNLADQPTAYDMPIGTTYNGKDMWVNLLEGDSFLVAGSRNMGKTGFLHGWIQALLHGGSVEVYGFDGKRGVEFSRYMDHPMFRMAHTLSKALAELKVLAAERRKVLLASGKPNILMYNETHPVVPILPIALFIDEAALTNDAEKAMLVEIVERERDTGIYPVLATNRPEAAALLVKTNLVTRVCFPVPSWNASQMVLGMNGAEALPKVQGRGLIIFKARVTEFQAFRVTYPEPTEETVKVMLERDQAETESEAAVIEPSPVSKVDADRVMELYGTGKSISAITRELTGQDGGRVWTRVKKQVETLVTTATTTTKSPDLTSFSPEMGLEAR